METNNAVGGSIAASCIQRGCAGCGGTGQVLRDVLGELEYGVVAASQLSTPHHAACMDRLCSTAQ